MYEFLLGRVAEIGMNSVVLDTGSIGYLLLASRQTLGPLQEGSDVRLWVHYHVTDSAHTLFGFGRKPERILFRRLLQVNGVGPTSALGLLSAMPPDELARCILDENLRALTAIKGVGKKTAERLIIELREHLTELAAPAQGQMHEAATDQDELAQVLRGLGFNPKAAGSAANNARQELGADADFQDLLRMALQNHTV
ncbi:MAG: Holliday junction branch migration protein RuvA [Planctomycetes bacterium]|nr:Holliday junction branch migration protein RuvA [Planctomycetota bacterium]